MSRRSGVLRPLPMLWVLAAGILGSSVSPTASAACKRDEPGYVWNYDGDIGGKYRARMSLVFRGRALEGVLHDYVAAAADKELADDWFFCAHCGRHWHV